MKKIELINWSTQIDQLTEEFVNSFGSLTNEQLNWKPNQDTWSIAQNIDHLIVTNETYYLIVQSIRNGKYRLPLIARINFIVSFFGRTVFNAVQPDRRKKMKTFSIWEPSKNEILFDGLEKFKKHQDQLKKFIDSSADLIEKGTVISSPANKYIVYKLETAFDIIVTHEKRHLAQARSVLHLR